MKKLFYYSLICLILFEFFNVYFIMPLPKSQELDSLELAYFLHKWRWFFRFVIGLGIVVSIKQAFANKKLIPTIFVLFTAFVVFVTNYIMKADHMFLKPNHMVFEQEINSKIPEDRVVIGVEHNGEAKAYRIFMLAYHHQIYDVIGGVPVVVTYCNVCRSGRVFEPKVNGKIENFRLVGMNHYNAMFEDLSTGSWWRQENGEAVVGKLTGENLPEMISYQMSLSKWLELNPESKILQPDNDFISEYDTKAKFEKGLSTGSLTRTDKQEWNDKSWVLGIEINNESKAYSWKILEKKRLINDRLGGEKIIVVLDQDLISFTVLENPTNEDAVLDGNQIRIGTSLYNLLGESMENKKSLNTIQAYQEFWHSWSTFHPKTKKYK